MSEPNLDLRSSLPPEVADLGTPEQVFPPGTGKRPPNSYLAVTAAWAALGLVLWVCAALAVGVIVIPGKPLPKDTGLMLGIPCMILGTLVMLYAAWHGMGGEISPHAYLFYKDVLVECSPTRHRIIRWESIRVATLNGGPARQYRFPVRDGKAILFDYTTPDHERLANAITRKRLLVAVGGETVADALPTRTPTPFFLAYTRVPGATYRVSRVGQNLLFLNMGACLTEEPKENEHNQLLTMGAIGGLMAGLQQYTKLTAYHKFVEIMDRLRAAGERELFQLAAEYPGSFLVSADDLREARIDPPSFWMRLEGTVAGRLRLPDTGDGKWTLNLPKPKDLSTATRELATLRMEASKPADHAVPLQA
jgi:hypothetical protein